MKECLFLLGILAAVVGSEIGLLLLVERAGLAPPAMMIREPD